MVPRWMVAFAMLVVFVMCVGASFSSQVSYIPKEGFVPDEKTAVRVAEAILIPIYGEDQVKHERPFSATLERDRWIVRGSLPDEENRGGIAVVEIAKADARILRVTHGK